MADSDYVLALSEAELARYRMMAGFAAEDEATDWEAAGIVPGARVADVGCGPGATLAVLADRVGPAGQADGVDGNDGTIKAAIAELGDRTNATARVGAADKTGLDAGSYDVAMCRHVLAHNGGKEQSIVNHLASLVRPGGAVFLVDVDLRATGLSHTDPDLILPTRYADFHASKGNDPVVGVKLGDLLEEAGCTVERYRANGRVFRPAPGFRPPAWAARDAMVAAGIVTEDEVARTEAALERMEASGKPPWLAVASFLAVGRKPA